MELDPQTHIFRISVISYVTTPLSVLKKKPKMVLVPEKRMEAIA